LDVGHASSRRQGRWLVLVVLLSAFLVGCGTGVEQVEVTARRQIVAPRPAGTSTFQGAVAAVDQRAGTIAVAVQIVWAPVLEARAHERRVLLDAQTIWVPGPGGISGLTVGEEVQVDAEDTVDGTWRAVRILLIDVD